MLHTLIELNRKLSRLSISQHSYDVLGLMYLEKAELVWSLVGTDDEGLDIPNIDIAAGHGKG